jgi:amphi-Trp domain-containing protein
MPNDKGENQSWKEQKGQLKLQRKQANQARKLARKGAKMERKLERQRERIVVANRSLVERARAAALIEELVEGVRVGKVSVKHGDQQLMVEPPEVVDVRVRARQTWKTQGLTIHIRWPRATAVEDSPTLEVNPS